MANYKYSFATLLLAVTALPFLLPGTAYAFPAYLDGLNSRYGKSFGCDVCHPYSANYGADFLDALNATGDNVQAYAAVEPLDSDGDGFTNLQELNAGTNPSSAASVPTSGSDTTPPSVSIVSPAAGVYAARPVGLSYTVSDGTARVFLDGAPIPTGAFLPGPGNGGHILRIEAADAAGNVGSSEAAFSVAAGLVTAVADLDASGAAELAVLGIDAAGKVRVIIKDSATGTTIKAVGFPDTLLPRALAAVPDLDGNSAAELAVLGIDGTGKGRVVLKDSATGALVRAVNFPAGFAPQGLAVVPDIDGNSAAELAVLGIDDAGKVKVILKDASTGALIRGVGFAAGGALQLAAVPDVNGNGAAELAVLAINAAGKVQAVLKDAVTGQGIRTVTFPAGFTPQALAVAPDVDGSGAAELAVLAIDDAGSVRVFLKDAATGSRGPTLAFPPRYAPQGLAVVDANLAVLGIDENGKWKVLLKEAGTGTLVATVAFPAPDQAPAPSGEAIYTASCAGCHAVNGYDASGAPDLAAKGSLVAAKFAASHNGVTLTAAEQTRVANFLNQYTAPPPPATGKSLYDSRCAGCHAVNGYDATGSPDLAGKGSLIAARFATSHNGVTLTAAEQTLVAGFLNQYTAPPVSSCTSCHGQPPSGTAAPNRAGAHQVHAVLSAVGTDCSVCHTGAAHNGQIDQGISSFFNAKTGAATPNSNQTCSNVSCHGGQTTPNWSTGTINVNTQCTSCHTLGTTQFNSYNSGQHSRSPHRNEACTACHNTTTLAAAHFTSLKTTAMEGPASATIGGGNTDISSYNASTRTCTNSCHGSETW